MITDSNKNLSVSRYNYLNLPEQIQIAMNGLNHIKYLYSAAGTKLARHTVEEGTPDEEITTDYIGSFVYEAGELQYLLTAEGRVVFNPDGTQDYQYFLKDHLGNTRVTFGEGGIIQEDSYYPFGMAMAGLSHQSGEDLPNQYLYNGKELQNDFGLGWYDYGARFYDPQIGRWHVPDPRSEKYYEWSPFNYVLNNPLLNVDPQGDTVRVYTETSGTGHAWMSVGEGENMTVYTYGRYAGTNEKSTGINTLSDGPGVLVKLEGQAALDYNQQKADNTGSTVFQVLDVTDEQVSNVMEESFNSSDQLPDKGEYKDDNRARVIDDYKLTDNNCTTKVADALNASGSKSMKSESVLNGGPNYSKGAERPVLPHSLKTNLTIKAQKRKNLVRRQERNEPK